MTYVFALKEKLNLFGEIWHNAENKLQQKIKEKV